jgi:hypothetical protein
MDTIHSDILLIIFDLCSRWRYVDLLLTCKKWHELYTSSPLWKDVKCIKFITSLTKSKYTSMRTTLEIDHIKLINDYERYNDDLPCWKVTETHSIINSTTGMTRMIELVNPKTLRRKDSCFIVNGFITGFIFQLLKRDSLISFTIWPCNKDDDIFKSLVIPDNQVFNFNETPTDPKSKDHPFIMIKDQYNGIITVNVKYCHLIDWLHSHPEIFTHVDAKLEQIKVKRTQYIAKEIERKSTITHKFFVLLERAIVIVARWYFGIK